MISLAMKKTYSVKSLCEKIWSLENQYDLLSWTIDGIYIWPLARFKIMTRLNIEKGSFSGAPHPIKRNLFNNLKLLSKSIISYCIYNPLRYKKHFPYILIPHQRKKDGYDIYSKQFYLDHKNDILLLDTNINSNAMRGSLNLDFHTYLANRLARFKKDNPSIFSHEDLEIIKNIESDLGIRIADLIAETFYRFKYLQPKYKKFFSNVRPKTVYILTPYIKPYIASAAQDLGIKVIEFQHGTITPYHLGYSYPGRPYVPYQPDEMLCFGTYWFKSTDLPEQTKTKVIGAPACNLTAIKTIESKNQDLIVFLSQGPIGLSLYKIAEETAQQRQDKHIVFRLHPSEPRSNYPSPHVKNLEISHGLSPSTYDLMNKADIVVGVSSTALFEAMCMGCKVAVVKLPSFEYMECVVANGDTIVVNDADDLIRSFDKLPRAADTTQYYAPRVDNISTD